jgi:hypothetical protein
MTLLIKPTIADVLDNITSESVNHRDVIASPKDLNATIVNYDNRLHFTINEEKVVFKDVALGQLLTKLQISQRFYNRCNNWIKKENVKYFNALHKNNYLFRMKKNNYIRATLSDSYGIIDNKDLFPVFFKELENRDDIVLSLFQYDDHITRLYIHFTDTEVEYSDKKYVGGLLVTNSETGHSSVWVEPVVSMLESKFFTSTGLATCSFTGRRLLKKQGVYCRIIHRGRFPHERIQSLVVQAKEIAQVGIIQLVEAFENSVSKEHAIKFINETDSFPNRFAQILESQWKEERRIAQAEVAYKMITLARGLPLFQQIQVEQAAGAFIGLFDNYKARFTNIMKDINNEAH